MATYGTIEFAETYDVEDALEDMYAEEELYGYPEFQDPSEFEAEWKAEQEAYAREAEWAMKANEELRQDPVDFIAYVLDVSASEITVSEVLEVTGANDSKTMVEAIVLHKGKTRQVKFYRQTWSATWEDPGDEDVDYELVWGEDFDL